MAPVPLHRGDELVRRHNPRWMVGRELDPRAVPFRFRRDSNRKYLTQKSQLSTGNLAIRFSPRHRFVQTTEELS